MNEVEALMEERAKRRCPLIISKCYSSVWYCDETKRPSGRIKVCLLETGDECETWDEIQEDMDAETD